MQRKFDMSPVLCSLARRRKKKENKFYYYYYYYHCHYSLSLLHIRQQLWRKTSIDILSLDVSVTDWWVTSYADW